MNNESYDIQIKNTLLETKHYRKMGIALWLFIWLLDKTTKVDSAKIGLVWGGKPIKYEDIAKDIAISRRTYERHIEILETGGYITTLRTPYGLKITVNKAHKYFGKRSATNGTSGYANNGTTVGESGTSHGTYGTSNKTIQLDNTIRQRGDLVKGKATKAPKLGEQFRALREQKASTAKAKQL